MQAKTKLALRRFGLRCARKLLDFLDDRLHAAEVRLREDLASHVVSVQQSLSLGHSVMGASKPSPARGEETGSMGRRRVSFAEWEMRRSGVAVISKKEARRQRQRLSAAAFDLRFAQR